jgi:hypothetical protein
MSGKCCGCKWTTYVHPPPPLLFVFFVSSTQPAVWHFPPKAAGQGIGQGTGDIIEYMARVVPSNHTRRHAWLDPDFLMTE